MCCCFIGVNANYHCLGTVFEDHARPTKLLETFGCLAEVLTSRTLLSGTVKDDHQGDKLASSEREERKRDNDSETRL